MLIDYYRRGIEQLSFALREAYVALLPYLIINSIATIVVDLFGCSQLAMGVSCERAINILFLLQKCFPILLMLSITYHLAKLCRIDRILVILLVATLFLGFSAYESPEKAGLDMVSEHSPILILTLPVASIWLLSKLLQVRWLLLKVHATLDDHTLVANQYVLPFVLSYLLIFSGYFISQVPFGIFSGVVNSAFQLLEISTTTILFIRTLLLDFFWTIGLHGSHTVDLLLDKKFLDIELFQGLHAKTFMDMFVFLGGAGSCWALAISVFWLAEDRHAYGIVRTGLPFLVFNINEIIIYGLPIVFNRQLAIPFVLAPLVNFVIAYSVFSLGILNLETISNAFAWTTPIFFNAYLLFKHSWAMISLQFMLLSLDVAIYFPFVKSFLKSQSTSGALEMLESKLEIATHIEAIKGLNFHKAQTHIVKAHMETNKIVELITENELLVYYQPKVKLSDFSCHKFEALLRLKMRDGKIVGPYFLSAIEDAGLAPVIDLWVSQQVAKDLRTWPGLSPVQISVNLHPDTLHDESVLREIADSVQGCHVQFEILEKAIISGVGSSQRIQQLHDLGFELAIDDFGTGFSSLECLFHKPIKVIKLDKFLADQLIFEHGLKIYQHTCAMLKDVGFTIVAEGIETQQQMDILEAAGVDFVQGYYFSPALPLERARKFVHGEKLATPLNA